AAEYAQKALRISREIHAKGSMATALLYLGYTYLSLQNYPQAAEAARQALTLGEELREVKMVWHARYILGSAHENLGDPVRAITNYQTAVVEIEKVRGQAGADEGKIGYFQ